MKRTANAVWKGSGKDGKGHLSTQSGVIQSSPYSFVTRFENEPGTNPEELVAAAHAGCFSMKLAFNLQAKGYTADEINTICEITLENGAITSSKLILKAKVPGISESDFQEQLSDAEKNCPISKLLNTAISTEYSLES